MTKVDLDAAAFTGLIDLVSEKIGGKALLASDEFFAEKENLLKPGRGIFIADKYTDRGKWMDGWESRRKRVPGHHWCIIKLGVPGLIKGVDIDTNHFLGNYPAYASIDAIALDPAQSDNAFKKENLEWTEILPKSALKGGSQNIFATSGDKRWSHIRLNIFPDGGVARLRVFGEVAIDWDAIPAGEQIDVAGIEHGGYVLACNDMFFGNKDNLIMPGRGINMGDGWETRRKREPGHDWAIIRLGHPALLKKIEVDTNHYKGNYPDLCWIDGVYAPGAKIDYLNWRDFNWTEILGKSKLQADHRHFYEKEISADGPWTHIRLNIAPDGGVSRLRIFGTPVRQSEALLSQGSASGHKSY